MATFWRELLIRFTVCSLYAPNFEKIGKHIGFGLSICLYEFVCVGDSRSRLETSLYRFLMDK